MRRATFSGSSRPWRSRSRRSRVPRPRRRPGAVLWRRRRRPLPVGRRGYSRRSLSACGGQWPCPFSPAAPPRPRPRRRGPPSDRRQPVSGPPRATVPVARRAPPSPVPSRRFPVPSRRFPVPVPPYPPGSVTCRRRRRRPRARAVTVWTVPGSSGAAGGRRSRPRAVRGRRPPRRSRRVWPGRPIRAVLAMHGGGRQSGRSRAASRVRWPWSRAGAA